MQKFGLVLFQRERPVQAQSLHFFDEGGLEVDGVAHHQVQKAAPQLVHQIPQQSQRAGRLRIAVLLETNECPEARETAR